MLVYSHCFPEGLFFDYLLNALVWATRTLAGKGDGHGFELIYGDVVRCWFPSKCLPGMQIFDFCFPDMCVCLCFIIILMDLGNLFVQTSPVHQLCKSLTQPNTRNVCQGELWTTENTRWETWNGNHYMGNSVLVTGGFLFMVHFEIRLYNQLRLVVYLSIYIGFLQWCGISSINSMTLVVLLGVTCVLGSKIPIIAI